MSEVASPLVRTVVNGPVFAEVPAPAFKPGPAGTHITIRGLTKYFAGWPLYENFDLDIPKHKIVSVFGPNGCGKSNLLEALRWVMGESSYKAMRATCSSSPC